MLWLTPLYKRRKVVKNVLDSLGRDLASNVRLWSLELRTGRLLCRHWFNTTPTPV
jgi:hypothetical protein